MAEPIPVDFLEKRRLLHGKGADRRRLAVAASLVDAGRLAESLEYLERNRDEAILARVRGEAVAAGDAFTLNRAAQIQKAPPAPEEWRELARRAEARERWFDCVNALEKAGDAEKAEEVRASRCPDFRPFRPAGK